MQGFGTEEFVSLLALVGIVTLIASLISGLIERTNFPQVAVFLALGAAVGAHGLGMIDISLESPALRVVATLSLALVLFTDALTLNLKEVRQQSKLTLLILGPGTLLSAALIALAAWGLLGLSIAGAVIVGAALASTDPVLLRGLLKRRDIPGAARQALRLESGLNDVVLLPIVVVAMTFLETGPSHNPDMGAMALNLFLLGPGAGVAVGLLSVATLDMVRRRVGIRRDYESLYSLGVAFAAFAAAEAVHGSGFLAAFAAGLTIAALDVEMCDCFLEYGETTAELLLLFTFVLLGSSLIWDGLGIISVPALLFAALVFLIRPIAFLLSLARSRLDMRSLAIISWFGPRGLSTLLIVLLPVFEGLPGSTLLFTICCLVVLISVVLHGGSMMMLGRGAARRTTLPAVAAGTGGGRQNMEVIEGPLHPGGMGAHGPLVASEPLTVSAPGRDVIQPVAGNGHAAFSSDVVVADGDLEHAPNKERISIEELRQLQNLGAPVVVIDARTDRTYEVSNQEAVGALRLDPDHAVREARDMGVPTQAALVVFCH